MTAKDAVDAVVIGAGIIGVSIALQLQQRGMRVLLLDRKGVASEASAGNAGAFAFADIEPLAAPGMLRKAPRWLLDPLGPISIPPAYALRLAPWLLRFWRASWPDRHAAGIRIQAQLMGLCRQALERQVRLVDGEHQLRRWGQLQLYEGQSEFNASMPGWHLRQIHGVDFDLLHSAQAIADIQPGIHPRFTHAGFTPQWISVRDPAQWTRSLADQFVHRGGRLEIDEVRGLAQDDDGVRMTSDLGQRRAPLVVVACGAWSHHLARTLGDRFPLETERGYNTTLPAGAFALKTQLTFSGHGFVISAIGDGIRVGGAVELGGLELAPHPARADILLRKAQQFLPGLKAEGGVTWMGFRPSLPDSLPIIDRSPKAPGVLYAFGHGHLGLTQSAGTAELVAQMVFGETPAMDLRPLSGRRFQ